MTNSRSGSGIFSVLQITFMAVLALFCGCCGKKAQVPVMTDKAVLLDVRSNEEFKAGHISGAVNIPHTEIAEKISAQVPEKDTPLYIYCRSGRRVKIAMKELKKLNYTNLYDLGGMKEAAETLRKMKIE